MNRNVKKMWPALATSLVLATSFVNAADNADMTRSKPNTDKQQKGSMGMITPPVNPAVQGVDFSLGVEALYFRATEDAVAVAVAAPVIGTYPQTSSITNQQYNWSWGARADAGFTIDHDGWDVQAQWTWFHSSHTQGRTAPSGGAYDVSVAPVAPLTSPHINIAALSLDSHRRLLINVGDLDLGREFFISKWLTLRPHVGARGLWLNRKLTVNAFNIATVSTTGLDSHTTRISQYIKSSFNAGGMYIGLDSQWGFGDGWSLFGMVDQSLVYGRNTYSISEGNQTANGAKYARAALTDKWNTVRGITDLAIGLRWDYMFDNDRYRLRLQAAWEEHLFSNLDVNNLGQTGDLALTGGSFKASFDF